VNGTINALYKGMNGQYLFERGVIMDIKEAIEAMNISYSKAHIAGDAEGVVALFSDNAYLMPPNQAMIQGKKELLEFYQMRVKKNRGNTLSNKMLHFPSFLR
jgi:hypothetical protein